MIKRRKRWPTQQGIPVRAKKTHGSAINSSNDALRQRPSRFNRRFRLGMISNGEYMPHPQTKQQQHVEFRIKELAETASKSSGSAADSSLRAQAV